jgi:hypothetical protein
MRQTRALSACLTAKSLKNSSQLLDISFQLSREPTDNLGFRKKKAEG